MSVICLRFDSGWLHDQVDTKGSEKIAVVEGAAVNE